MERRFLTHLLRVPFKSSLCYKVETFHNDILSVFIFYYHLLRCSFCDFCVSVTTGKRLNQAAAPCLPCMAFPRAQLPQQQGLGLSDYHPQRKPTSGEVLGQGCPSVGNVLGRSPFATSLVTHTVPCSLEGQRSGRVRVKQTSTESAQHSYTSRVQRCTCQSHQDVDVRTVAAVIT